MSDVTHIVNICRLLQKISILSWRRLRYRILHITSSQYYSWFQPWSCSKGPITFPAALAIKSNHALLRKTWQLLRNWNLQIRLECITSMRRHHCKFRICVAFLPISSLSDNHSNCRKQRHHNLHALNTWRVKHLKVLFGRYLGLFWRRSWVIWMSFPHYSQSAVSNVFFLF